MTRLELEAKIRALRTAAAHLHDSARGQEPRAVDLHNARVAKAREDEFVADTERELAAHRRAQDRAESALRVLESGREIAERLHAEAIDLEERAAELESALKLAPAAVESGPRLTAAAE